MGPKLVKLIEDFVRRYKDRVQEKPHCRMF